MLLRRNSRVFLKAFRIILIVFAYGIVAEKPDLDTLQLVHVLFRHGHRTNDVLTVYPKDPYKNFTYPMGLGQLTNEGKLWMYDLGKSLRKRYDGFLDDFYTPGLIDATCSHVPRAQASLLLVLAGLFPPTETEKWSPEMNWQPIPINYKQEAEDLEFFGISCPAFDVMLDALYESTPYREYLQTQKNLTDYLSKHTGWNVTNFFYFTRIYLGLLTEEEYGLKLPKWTKKVYPSPLEELAPEFYYDYTNSAQMTKYAAGFMLKRIITDANDKIVNEAPENRKLHLLSGHELNCAFIMRAMGVFRPHIIPYGGHVIFELHKINDTYGYKIYYQDFRQEDPVLQHIPGCGTFCPFEKFVNLHKNILPDKKTKC